MEELEQLRQNVGDELYQQLTREQADWIIKAEGSIDLGRNVTAEEISKILDEYKN